MKVETIAKVCVFTPIIAYIAAGLLLIIGGLTILFFPGSEIIGTLLLIDYMLFLITPFPGVVLSGIGFFLQIKTRSSKLFTASIISMALSLLMVVIAVNWISALI